MYLYMILIFIAGWTVWHLFFRNKLSHTDQLRKDLNDEMEIMCKPEMKFTKFDRIERMFKIIHKSKASQEDKDFIVDEMYTRLFSQCINILKKNVETETATED